MKYLAALLVIAAVALAEKRAFTSLTTCSVCKQVMPSLKEHITVVEMLGAQKLSGLCNRLVEKYRSSCKDLVAKTFHRLAELIAQDNTEETCKQMQLCGVFDRKLDSGILCDAVRALYDHTDELAELIGNDAKEICEKSPELDAETCDILPMQIMALAKMGRPKIKHYSGLLPFKRCEIGVEELTPKERFMMVVRQKDGKNVGTQIVCNLCSTMVLWLKNAIMDPNAYVHRPIKDALRNALNETCQVLPLLKAQCNYLVTYLFGEDDDSDGAIFDVLYNLLDPQRICPLIGCPAQKADPSIEAVFDKIKEEQAKKANEPH